MEIHAPVVFRDGDEHSWAVLRRFSDHGISSLDLCAPIERFWENRECAPPIVRVNVDAKRVTPRVNPAQVLRDVSGAENWVTQSRESLDRLRAYFLLVEDPQHRLDARPVSTLAHQVSLVRHIVENPSTLPRMLIADEVGLGKTVEAGLLLKEWLGQNENLRVLYLAPARLVTNVRRELDRFFDAPRFRQFTAFNNDADPDRDQLIIASIHKAVHSNHTKAFTHRKSSPNVIQRWDVLIVDECHHLTDWSSDGTDPTRKLKLVRELIDNQPKEGRLILLSGTPHQGHQDRFSNLLKLLHGKDEANTAVAGRVIFRTKDDVSDWNGNPLFPARLVNQPIVVDFGVEHREWYDGIRSYFSPRPGISVTDGHLRSLNWRRAQALQWAASSPQAGLAYLVRHAIRSGSTLSSRPVLEGTLEALRPYRGGSADESIKHLFDRIRKVMDISQEAHDAEDEDTEVVDDELQKCDREGKGSVRDALSTELDGLLHRGIILVRAAGVKKWDALREQIIERTDLEKIVLFAQPIETVTALVEYLERTTGQKPAMIVGGQSDQDRTAQIELFRRSDGPRFLVSSRAGGEGINLQVARRLVHLDVPWNPMDMEQRVGRVHRFGSKETIMIDTIVVKDSREADAYIGARKRLETIVRDLADPALRKFDALFARVMNLVPPEEFRDLILEGDSGNLSEEQHSKLNKLVTAGFDRWKKFHDDYAGQMLKIRSLDAGLATWEDVRGFLREQSGAESADGFRTCVFRRESPNSEPILMHVPAPAVRLADGAAYIAFENDGMPVEGPNGEVARPLGLNLPAVAGLLRKLALARTTTGAAQLRWADGTPPEPARAPFGILVLLVQRMRSQNEAWIPHSQSLHCYCVSDDGKRSEWRDENRVAALRGIMKSTTRRDALANDFLVQALVDREAETVDELRRPSPDPNGGHLFHAVTPLLAAVVSR